MSGFRRDLAAACAVPSIVFLAVYGSAAGHGFISDDFAWIVQSRIAHMRDLLAIFTRQNGFYRPAVTLSFGVNQAIFGNHPLGYGLTNLALAAGCGVLLYRLLRVLLMPARAALLGSALWLLNFHGIAMAILWISGRTALLLTAASLAAAIALVRGRTWTAAVFLAVALLSKEEAVALPFILLVWLVVLPDLPSAGRRNRALLWMALSGAVLAIYAALRAHSGAMTPATAPDFYRFTFVPRLVGANALAYADRALTFPAAVSLLAFAVLRPATAIRVSWPRLVCGLAWIAGGYGLTLFLPVRSSLYACFPSVGASVIAAEVCGAMWQASQMKSHQRAIVAGIVLLVCLAPVYHVRNRRWVEPARFSASILQQLQGMTATVPDNSNIVLFDDREKRVNLESTFGTLINEAYFVQTGRHLALWIEPPLRDAALAGLVRPCERCVSATFTVRNGALTAGR